MSSESEKAAVPVAITSQPAAASEAQPIEKRVTTEQDIESLKVGAMPEPRIGDGGARQAELMQLAWGKHGRRWIFFGLGLCMLA